MSNEQQPLLLRFFNPSLAAPDARNRTLPAILSWPDEDLERSHDYIQTVFPLPEESMFSFAPIVTPEIRNAFLAQPELQSSLRHALERMLSFYGLEISFSPLTATTGNAESKGIATATATATVTVTRGPNWAANSPNFVTRFNHNHLRITRIIRSLRVLGLPDEAKALYGFLSTDEKVTQKVSERSQMYWRRAAERGLHLPPDEEDEGADGIAWLREG